MRFFLNTARKTQPTIKPRQSQGLEFRESDIPMQQPDKLPVPRETLGPFDSGIIISIAGGGRWRRAEEKGLYLAAEAARYSILG